MLFFPSRYAHFRRCAEVLIFLACAWCTCVCLASRTAAQMGLSALPTMLRVPLLEQHNRVRLVPSAAYGFTESVLPGKDRHHRVSGGGGIAASSENGLAGELRMDARYDQHVVPGPSDESGVIDARALARYSRPASDAVSVGAQLGVWVPGEKAPRPAFSATTVDALAIFAVRASERITVSVDAGYRFDRSARSVKAPERLSKSDWISLGVSDFDAMLLGLGVQQSLDSLRWFAEVSADVLVGAGAPSFARSPLRAALGASTELGRPSTRGSLIVQGLLSDRSPVQVSGALAPVEPRISVMLALSQDFTWGDRPTPVEVRAAPEPVAAPVVAEPAPASVALPIGVLRVFVRDTDRGEALPARIRVTTPQGEPVTAEQKLAARGGLEMELSPGSYEVEISADGFAPQRRRLSIDEHGVTVINIDLRPKGAR